MYAVRLAETTARLYNMHMDLQRKYYQDKLMLLLASSNVFLAFLIIALVFLRLGQGSGEGYIVEYRSNLGISAFTNGSLPDMLTFVGFALLMVITIVLLSMRVYTIRRVLSVSVLGAGILVLLLTLVVSNALLVLR